MGLIADISTIVTAKYPAANYMLSSRLRGQVATLHTGALPLIILNNEISKNTELKKNANLLKDTRIVISVFNYDTHENTDAQTQAIVDACENIADVIMQEIFSLVAVRLPSGNQRWNITPEIRVFSNHLSGVTAEARINYNTVVNF